MTAQPLRVAFVTGATPDRWARTWRERRRDPIELVPVTEEEQLDGVRSLAHDLALARLPEGHDGWRDAAPPLHRIPLYEEQPVVVAGREHWLAAAGGDEEVALDDLADEQLVAPHASGWTPAAEQLAWPPMSPREAVETVAAGTGVVLLPGPVARLLGRRDVVTRLVAGLPSSTVGLVWRVDRGDDERVQAFVGVVRGRSARSSRS